MTDRSPDPEAPVEVYRTRRAKRAREHGLVLQAIGIPFGVQQVAGHQILVVPQALSERARRELEEYDEENRGWPRPEAIPEVLTEGAAGVLSWSAFLIVLFAFQVNHAFGFDWLERGATSVEAVRAGELWRPLTSLGLHVDLQHLAGNLFIGALFVGIACQLLGTGLAINAVLLSGFLGNLLNVWLQQPGFSSVGASTALFGALGILGGNRFMRRRQIKHGTAKSWIPLVACAFLLSWQGLGGATIENPDAGRVDVLGHICGFVVGVAIGMAHGHFGRGRRLTPRVQVVVAVASYAVWVAAWGLSLATG